MLKNIPPVTRNLLFINIIIFMVQLMVEQRFGDQLSDLFGLHFYLAEDFRVWQLLTYMFLHGSWAHVLLNMFSLWMFGRVIEQTMGQRRFLIYYFICGIGAGLCQELWQTGEYYYNGFHLYSAIDLGGSILPMGDFLNQWVTIGASGACYGVLLAFGMTFPEERIMLLFPPIPMKAKYFVIGYAFVEAYSAFASNGNVAHFAHLGGMLFGWLYFVRCRRQAARSRGFRAGYGAWTNTPGAQAYGSSGAAYSSGGGVMQRIGDAFRRMGAQAEQLVRKLFSKAGGTSRRGDESRRYANPDHEYNTRRRAQQERIDAILDKVRRSGYASLTEEEKRELFNNSNRR